MGAGELHIKPSLVGGHAVVAMPSSKEQNA